MPVKAKIRSLLKDLHEGIYEKEAVIALGLLASIAGESLFLLGPPGVAKSLIARRLKYAYKNAPAFEYLMSHFSTPDEIFGPVSISKLKDEDKYERITARYLPGASVAFLDEIWKAGPSIQNALLTALNEKVYRNGEQEIQIPLRALIAASNELPLKGQGLDALWDRFLVRFPVGGVRDGEKFKAMISRPMSSRKDPVAEKNKITDEEYQEWSGAVDLIAIPDHILNLILLIKTHYLEAYNSSEERDKKQLYISDRRWRKIVRLLRTSAFLNDRKAVDLMDCFLISHCIWNVPEEIDLTAGFVREAVERCGYIGDFDAGGLREELAELRNEIAGATRTIQDTRGTALQSYNQMYYAVMLAHKTFYLKQQDFHTLTDEDKPVRLYSRQTLSAGYLYKQGGSGFGMEVNGVPMDMQTLFAYDREVRIRKSGREFSAVVDGEECRMETIAVGGKRRITKKPGQHLTAGWDARTARLSAYLNERKIQIEKHGKQDAKHIRNNLFVNPEYAAAVESHIVSARTEIDKLEVEIREIQHHYRHIQDEERDLS